MTDAQHGGGPLRLNQLPTLMRPDPETVCKVFACMIRNMGGSEDQSSDQGPAGARINAAAVKARHDCPPGPLADLSADHFGLFSRP